MPSQQLQLKFDPNQEHQLQAVASVVDLFEGYPRSQTGFRLGEEIVPNFLANETLDRHWLEENLRRVQERNKITGSTLTRLEIEEAMVVEGAGHESWDYPSFTVEMETGTGKTYAYLRTVHELRQRYGWGKYVVVVPSVAIFEGVVKTFEITRSHFGSLFGNERVNLIRYDGTQLSRLRTFAQSSFCELLVITLDAFNKISNNIYKASERLAGELWPYQFIQGTRPILILDEPQNMESDLAKSALATLHPILALRYSATHKRSPNLIFRLTPFQAFQTNLVKRIQVWGVTEREDFNRPFLSLDRITNQGGIRASVTTYLIEGGRTREAQVRLKQGDDLFDKTGRPEHKAGYVVAEIHAGEEFVRFENGTRIDRGAPIGPSRPEIFRVQIEETVRQHFSLQVRLRPKRIKVLSLFFIDRVSSYVADDGIVKSLFDKAFRRLAREYGGWKELKPEEVRSAYFAKAKGTVTAIDLEVEEENQTKGQREAAKEQFALIMRDKERLLSFDEKVAFIFAHSALKEGWDNPNVFQICTLNQTVSETKKRQEIGRGLRLCVNQDGERVHGDDVNVLTVVANQNYDSYARQLQQEYVDEGEAEDRPPPPSNARKRPAKRNDEIFIRSTDFKEFWRRLSQRIHYRIHLDSTQIISTCVGRLSYAANYPEPRLVLERGDWVVHKYTFLLESARGERCRIRVDLENTKGDKVSSSREYALGDDLARLQSDTRLRGFRLEQVASAPQPHAVFENKVTLYQGQPEVYQSEAGQQLYRREVVRAESHYPVFNLVDRAAAETTLTRHTINEIFRRLPRDVKIRLFRNPEGFAGYFIGIIRSTLADLVASSIEFVIEGHLDRDLEQLFPREKPFVQKELVEAGTHGLYDLVQVDAENERAFVEQLKHDEKVIFYFKFPPVFRINFPRLIGNYNPDWGVVRMGEDGKFRLYLVRETKGSLDLDALQFPHEKRKVLCAKRYFATMGVDYRHVKGDTPAWWEPAAAQDNLDIA